MKGVFRIVNPSTSKVYGYYAIDDIEDLDSEFRRIVDSDRHFQRRKDCNEFVPELVEITEDTNRRLAYYLWPQLARLQYNDNCFEYLVDKKYSRTIDTIIDWLVDHYQSPGYSFIIDAPKRTLIYAYVYERGNLLERYGFNTHTNEPYERGFIERQMK